MDAIQGYWTRRGRGEAIIAHGGEARRDAFREHPVWLGVLPLLLGQPDRPLRVADLGCGTGIMAAHAARLGHRVIAIDFAETRAAVARARLSPFPQAELRIGDAAAPPLAQGEVDVIISRNLLWLLPDPLAAVAAWRALVAPGGRWRRWTPPTACTGAGTSRCSGAITARPRPRPPTPWRIAPRPRPRRSGARPGWRRWTQWRWTG
jgi:SAM-dependent methyltransferase